jgi:hypothetical protein
MLAQASILVFTTGLLGRPPTTQFPPLTTKKILVVAPTYNTRKDTILRPGYASLTGRHKKLPSARAGHDTDMISHLC